MKYELGERFITNIGSDMNPIDLIKFLLKYKSGEDFVARIGADVYPITLVKFLLNKRKILSYFNNMTREDFIIKFKQTLSSDNCKMCQQFEDGKLCRNHTSIKRVLNANNVLYDLDTKVYFYKNEIFKMINDKLVIIYCPHPKMISGTIDDEKVRKINPLTMVDPFLTKLPKYKNIYDFNSSDIDNECIKCWFNKDFNIITIPKNKEKHNWCLIDNKKGE